MQGTIYVTPTAMETIATIRDLDFYDRCSLSDDGSVDWSTKEGYYLKNSSEVQMAILPKDASIALRLYPEAAEEYSQHVSMPVNLRGCIFEQAPFLPEDYASIMRYWSGASTNANVSGAVFYQNSSNAYLVDLSALDESEKYNRNDAPSAKVDALLSEGIAVSVAGLGSRLTHARPDQFVEIVIPVDETMLGLDNGAFMTNRDYDLRPKEQCERIFLKVADIQNSPKPDQVFLELRYEQLDYGYHY